MFDDVSGRQVLSLFCEECSTPSPHHPVLRVLKGTSENTCAQSGRGYNRCTERVGSNTGIERVGGAIIGVQGEWEGGKRGEQREWEEPKQVAKPDLQSFLYR